MSPVTEKRKHSGGRPPSAKTLALRIARDSSQATLTRWQAVLLLEPLIPSAELEVLIRQLLAGTKRGRVVRLCLAKLIALEKAQQERESAPCTGSALGCQEPDLLGIFDAPSSAPTPVVVTACSEPAAEIDLLGLDAQTR